jgi:UDP-glucuronate decarboxylase
MDAVRALHRLLVMQRIIVTGGAGFLGSHLCERLAADGHRVVCVDDLSTARRRNVELLSALGVEVVRRDVTAGLLTDADQIYHLACPASPRHYQRNPVRTLETAVKGTFAVLDRALAAAARVLIASTSAIYGDPEVHPQPEGYRGSVSCFGERSCYDEGKRCGEAIAWAYANHYGLEVRVARIFNTYGPRMSQNDGRVVSNFVVQALTGRTLTVYGAGDQTRSFCYVSDLVEGLVRLMEADADPGPTNLGNPEDVTVRKLAEDVLELTGSSSEIARWPLPPGDPIGRRPDITRARQALGWSPGVSLRTGLTATIKDFRARLAATRRHSSRSSIDNVARGG